MKATVLHIEKPNKDILNVFMSLRAEKEAKKDKVKINSSNKTFKKI
ncbi:hypothetical protein [Empedobacter stercoris]